VGSTDDAGRGENPVAPDGVVLPVTTRVPTQRVEAPVTAGGDCLMGLTRGFPRLGEPVGPPPYGAQERAPRGTLSESHRTGFPPDLGRGWRDTAPGPARRGP